MAKANSQAENKKEGFQAKLFLTPPKVNSDSAKVSPCLANLKDQDQSYINEELLKLLDSKNGEGDSPFLNCKNPINIAHLKNKVGSNP